jgi:site-specific DNA recombinase
LPEFVVPLIEELVTLVNQDLTAGYTHLKEKVANIDFQIIDVENRLSKLYDALKTDKVTLDDLSPRIKELRSKQNELSKGRVIAEAELTIQNYQQLDIEAIHSYVNDLARILEESEVAQRKGFLRSFVKKIIIDKDKVKIYYKLPVPPDGKRSETIEFCLLIPQVGKGGLEPPRIAALDPKSSPSASSGTPPRFIYPP